MTTERLSLFRVIRYVPGVDEENFVLWRHCELIRESLVHAFKQLLLVLWDVEVKVVPFDKVTVSSSTNFVEVQR